MDALVSSIPLERHEFVNWYIFRDILAAKSEEEEETQTQTQTLRDFDMLSPWLPKFSARADELLWPDVRKANEETKVCARE